MNLTNDHDIPLYLAVWLLQDSYDYVNDPKYVSATSLLRPTKELILSGRVDQSVLTSDLSDFISRRLGSSLHDSVEISWKKGLAPALKLMGYTDEDISSIVINPKRANPQNTNVYLEQRSVKELAGYKIGGKYDFVMNGVLHDLKTTSAFSFMYSDKDEDYALQGSIYRWLNPEVITEDFIRITFIFTDWQAATARINPDYPQQRIATKEIPLLSELETERWIRNKLNTIQAQIDLPQIEITPCTPTEMWMSDSIWKYFANPNSARSSKNFRNPIEAYSYLQEKGGKGEIREFPGEPRKCQKFCNAFAVCEQGRSYFTEE